MKIFKSMRFKGIFKGFRTQLIIFFTISLLVMSLASYFSYISTMDIIKKGNEKYFLQQFRQSGYNIGSLMNEVDRLTKLFLLNDDIQNYIKSNSDLNYENITIHKDIINDISKFMVYYSYINSIYIFTENKAEIGSGSFNSISVLAGKERHEFFSSSLYNDAKTFFPVMVWDGGRHESYFNSNISNNDIFLISAARGVKAINEPKRSATLIFNIDERYFASIYGRSAEAKDSYMYIIDKYGEIISSSDGKNIGKSDEIVSNIDLELNYGSFISRIRNSSSQVIYYKIENTDWYLVGEIPLKLFSQDIMSLQRIIIIIFTTSILLVFIVSILWLKKITGPLNILSKKMKEISKGRLGLTFPKIPDNELGLVIKRFNEMSLSIVELIKKNEENEKEKRDLEIEALRAQINPHFLYNTLNMIKWMAAVIKARNIMECIVALGNILEPTFKNADTICTLKEELEYVGNYLKIMNWRFGNGISFNFDISDKYLDYKLPRFILQPLIENSITHGMKNQEEAINIYIDASETDKDLVINVSDTGEGIPGEMLKELNEKLANDWQVERIRHECSIGIPNVNRRIRLYFGNNYGISLQNSEKGGARVKITIPKIT